MLGIYKNFPKVVHGVVRVALKTSPKNIQQAIAATFFRMNQKHYRLEEIANPSNHHCEVDFEFGIGEEATFSFLDEGALGVLKAAITKKPLDFLDFLGVLQYHLFDELRRRAALKSDYYFLRFAFSWSSMELLISHERGPRRVHVEDLIDFLLKHVTSELIDHHDDALELKSERIT